MNVFYAPGIDGVMYTLSREESRHTVRVLRMGRNDEVKLVDGIGNMHSGIIENADPDHCTIRITGSEPCFEKRDYHLHIAISPLKNSERLDWFIEKAVEIGIDEITPVVSRRTERKSFRAERAENIIISAMKQSLKAYKPILNAITPFNEFIKGGFKGSKFIATCESGFEKAGLAGTYSKGENALIMIGPEGDYTSEEVSMALSSGFTALSLGKARLRTETAGLAACHSISFLNL